MCCKCGSRICDRQKMYDCKAFEERRQSFLHNFPWNLCKLALFLANPFVVGGLRGNTIRGKKPAALRGKRHSERGSERVPGRPLKGAFCDRFSNARGPRRSPGWPLREQNPIPILDKGLNSLNRDMFKPFCSHNGLLG